MDDTWRKALGIEAINDGEALCLEIQTIDGRWQEIRLVPEMIPHLISLLMQGKTLSHIASGGSTTNTSAVDPVHMRLPFVAEELILTNSVDRGRCLVQIPTPSGGIFEFLIPLDPDGTIRGKNRRAKG